MKLMLALYFFILALIQAGLLVGIYHYYRTQNLVKPSPYWMGSLLISVIALLIFGGGILTVSDIAKPQFNFTVANTLFVAAAIFQGLFCKSLNQKVTRRELYAFGVGLLLFAILFDVMRRIGTFEIRTIAMASLASVLYVWQIKAIRKRRAVEVSAQLQYLQYATIAELFLALSRIGILIAQSYTIRDVEQIPQFLILATIFQLVMNTLSYIAIGGYWSERISIANTRSQVENQEVRELLLERETLINSLLKANKTVATGALSASLAHELNQPLGASHLNIQFLQKKLADGEVDPALQKEILDTLLSDNQRAASIIRSLRSIFADEKLTAESIDFSELMDSVISIVRPELQFKSIEMVLNLEKNLMLRVNRSEIQQVMLNLMNNAIHALNSANTRGKSITVDGRYIQDGIEISVIDNGPGLTEGAQARLFELLSTERHKGMGLGLWLCQHIVIRHGGKIWYEKQDQGGAKFSFILPYQS
jgi:signal transduction histidine kinase